MIAKKEPFKALKLEVSDIHVLGTPTQVLDFCKSWPLQPKQRFVFDLEGVLIVGSSTSKGGSKGSGQPVAIARNIETCKRLKQQGHVIIVQSTRPYHLEKQTWDLSQKLGVPCDDLRLGKPIGEYYIGGSNMVDSILMDIDKQVGFYPTDVRATKQQKAAAMRKPKMTPVRSLKPDSKGVTCL